MSESYSPACDSPNESSLDCTKEVRDQYIIPPSINFGFSPTGFVDAEKSDNNCQVIPLESFR